MNSALLRQITVVKPSGQEVQDVWIQDDLIQATGMNLAVEGEEVDCSTAMLFSGFIDCHVHFREPGFPQKADMQSESLAARAGGITTVCDMPNTNPPTVTKEAFEKKVALTERMHGCDIRLFFGITEALHIEELRSVCAEPALRERLCGVKLYLDHSTGNQKVDGGIVEEIFRTCKELGLTLVAHCEDPEMNEKAASSVNAQDIAAHSLRRPPESEVSAIAYAISIAKKYGTHLHIAHLSTAGGIDLVRQAKADHLLVTCEVAPHHLFLSTEDYGWLGTLGKMNPPLRSPEHVAALWQGIQDHTVDCIATDHAPHTLSEKQNREPLQAPSGVPGVQTMIPLFLTVAAGKWPHPHQKHPGYTLRYADVARLCWENPNKIFSLEKQPIEEGSHADVVIVLPQEEYILQGSELLSKCKWTPYEGWKVVGRVVTI